MYVSFAIFERHGQTARQNPGPALHSRTPCEKILSLTAESQYRKESDRTHVMSHPHISIVIPAYNEAARLETALSRVTDVIAARGWDAEVLIVDDGSTDETADIAQYWIERHHRLRLIQNPGNRGKGFSVRNGLLQAAGDIVMFTDADLSAPMEEAERLFAAIDSGADAVDPRLKVK